MLARDAPEACRGAKQKRSFRSPGSRTQPEGKSVAATVGPAGRCRHYSHVKPLSCRSGVFALNLYVIRAVKLEIAAPLARATLRCRFLNDVQQNTFVLAAGMAFAASHCPRVRRPNCSRTIDRPFWREAPATVDPLQPVAFGMNFSTAPFMQ
jgi:hypothetical protein